jgi:hypothetical protein
MTKARLASTLFAVCFACAALSAAPARASLVVAMDLNDLSARADHIAITDVLSVRSQWDDRHNKIFTTIELSVVESWKGGAAPASHITVVQPGGTVGDVAMTVFGLSQFTPGERALVFLRGNPASAGLVGMAQGKRPMHRDPSTGQWIVAGADHAGLHLVKSAATRATPATPVTAAPAASAAPIVAPAAAADDRPRPLDELRGQVREILKAKR